MARTKGAKGRSREEIEAARLELAAYKARRAATSDQNKAMQIAQREAWARGLKARFSEDPRSEARVASMLDDAKRALGIKQPSREVKFYREGDSGPWLVG